MTPASTPRPAEPPLPWLAWDMPLIFQWALNYVAQDAPSDKPPMPAHDYALQWALDTASGPSIGPRFPWGERNLARCYIEYHAQIATLTAQLAEARGLLERSDNEIQKLVACEADPNDVRACHYANAAFLSTPAPAPAGDVVRVEWSEKTQGHWTLEARYYVAPATTAGERRSQRARRSDLHLLPKESGR